jgi:hypothetical protein
VYKFAERYLEKLPEVTLIVISSKYPDVVPDKTRNEFENVR